MGASVREFHKRDGVSCPFFPRMVRANDRVVMNLPHAFNSRGADDDNTPPSHHARLPATKLSLASQAACAGIAAPPSPVNCRCRLCPAHGVTRRRVTHAVRRQRVVRPRHPARQQRRSTKGSPRRPLPERSLPPPRYHIASTSCDARAAAVLFCSLPPIYRRPALHPRLDRRRHRSTQRNPTTLATAATLRSACATTRRPTTRLSTTWPLEADIRPPNTTPHRNLALSCCRIDAVGGVSAFSATPGQATC
ncbi:hypothetical protein HYPSUDRAFT_558024 [Hypholoma sublateritium FD-334 SS-4]|uniref:Uncharacterized protein n=1 Tax=Hypholoma sublateritium (strain FD-334 SS-4) TaxID=945553 RepID=A0A0D2PWF9_HYPSF|nr:hypothetical protein HYPSUDRAFT_558024 [Hypholoma sublateritium FD-334 SS-4]